MYLKLKSCLCSNCKPLHLQYSLYIYSVDIANTIRVKRIPFFSDAQDIKRFHFREIPENNKALILLSKFAKTFCSYSFFNIFRS